MTTGQRNWRLAHCDSQDSADEVQEQFEWERQVADDEADHAAGFYEEEQP